ncbi:division/cell wall cluster transcriptional repressor MraZ [Roseomonas elaeocarpi]|uniref:Transcriptional regulator MraZ n=1 Tax=Roseomonas elaeocarpi TaxID=907779 RepID=A0ABV6JV40_9PROT
MTLFLGTFTNKLDKKGRVSIPAPFRGVLTRLGVEDIVLRPYELDPCVEGWPQSAFEHHSAAAEPVDPFEDPQDDLLLTLFSQAEGIRPDGEGRVTLREDLIAHANITDSVCFAGMGKKFQIWEPTALRHRLAEAAKARQEAQRIQRAMKLANGPLGTGAVRGEA